MSIRNVPGDEDMYRTSYMATYTGGDPAASPSFHLRKSRNNNKDDNMYQSSYMTTFTGGRSLDTARRNRFRNNASNMLDSNPRSMASPPKPKSTFVKSDRILKEKRSNPDPINFSQFQTIYQSTFRPRPAGKRGVAELGPAGQSKGGPEIMKTSKGAELALHPPIKGGHLTNLSLPQFIQTNPYYNNVPEQPVIREKKCPGYTGYVVERPETALGNAPLKNHIPGYSGYIYGKKHAIGKTQGRASANAFIARPTGAYAQGPPPTYRGRQLGYVANSMSATATKLTPDELRYFFQLIGEPVNQTKSNVEALLAHTVYGQDGIVTDAEFRSWLEDLCDRQPSYWSRIQSAFNVLPEPAVHYGQDVQAWFGSERKQLLEQAFAQNTTNNTDASNPAAAAFAVLRAAVGSDAEFQLVVAEAKKQPSFDSMTHAQWFDFVSAILNEDQDRWQRLCNTYSTGPV